MRSSDPAGASGGGRVSIPTTGTDQGGPGFLRPLPRRIYERAELIVLEKRLEPSTVGRAGTARGLVVEAREALPAEVLQLSDALNGGPGAQQRETVLLSQGYRCALCFSAGEAIGSFWWTDARISGSGAASRDPQISFLGLDLEDGDAWGFRNRILPASRGGGTATRMLQAIEELLAEMGYRRMLGSVEPRNISARWLYEIRGFKPIRTVEIRCFCSVVGVSNGRVFVRNRERRSPTTFPYRRLGRRG
jgi:GNAT superfamily N-acetyltransferase